MDGIAKTSLLTAAMRAAETKRKEEDGRLLNDPYAELLAGDEGTFLRKKAIEETGDNPAIALRTNFMDNKISAAIDDGVKQIVMLAAGMDTRAYRMHFPKGFKIYELDRKEVFQYKQSKLKNHNPNCELRQISVDLRNEWKDQLLKEGFRSNLRTLWMVEGLTMYLDEANVTTLMQRISKLAQPQDYMLADILSRTLLDAPYMQAQLDFLAGMGAPWKFGTNHPEEFLEKFGWKAYVTQTGEVDPKRWPFPIPQRNIPHVPRGFLIEARKL